MKNSYKANTIVLIKYSFTDSSDFKVRPALVICDQLDEDLTCLPISSSHKTSSLDFELQTLDAVNFSFPIKSFVRLTKLSTLSHLLVVKKLGSLKKETFEKIKKMTINFLSGSHSLNSK